MNHQLDFHLSYQPEPLGTKIGQVWVPWQHVAQSYLVGQIKQGRFNDDPRLKILAFQLLVFHYQGLHKNIPGNFHCYFKIKSTRSLPQQVLCHNLLIEFYSVNEDSVTSGSSPLPV